MPGAATADPPMPRRVRLHHRIVIPFVLVALVTSSAVAYLALSVISRALAARVEAQLLNTSEVISRNSGFALNPAILRSVKEITGIDVVTFTAGGAILASTVDGSASPDWLPALVTTGTAQDTTLHGNPPRVRQMACGVPCYVVYRAVPTRSGAVVALIAETSELTAANAAMTRTIVAATAVSLFVMMLVSQAVARRVTAPMDALVRFAHDVSGGASDRRAAIGADEVGRLAAAFNEMLDRLAASRDALVKSEKLGLTGLLAARVAHDIRNPLSSIKMRAQLLQARFPEENGRKELDAILHDIDLVESVVLGLLELARPGQMHLKETFINDVVREVLQQLSTQLAYRKIRSAVTLDETLPRIALDRDRFKLALMNVIVNAADAMPRGGTLEITTARRDGSMQLEVCDDGTGIDPALLDRVFDPFVSTKRDGIGLGLVNAKAIMDAHGGRIGLTARDGGGTRVTMTLPLVRETNG